MYEDDLIMVKRISYLNKLNKLKDTKEIKIITGARRSGKTHLLQKNKDKMILNNLQQLNG